MAATFTEIKEERYASLYLQLQGLIDLNLDLVANMANFCAAVQQSFQFHWVGFYRVIDEELILGPFQGPPACVRILQGRGVCGAAWQRQQTIIVDDVDQYPGHIACSPLSRSEIVVPVFSNGDTNNNASGKTTKHKVESNVVAVLDIDADVIAAFDHYDKIHLERCLALLSAANS